MLGEPVTVETVQESVNVEAEPQKRKRCQERGSTKRQKQDKKRTDAKKRKNRDQSNVQVVRAAKQMPHKLQQAGSFAARSVPSAASGAETHLDTRVSQMSRNMDEWRVGIETTLIDWQKAVVGAVNKRLTALELRSMPPAATVAPPAGPPPGKSKAKGKPRKLRQKKVLRFSEDRKPAAPAAAAAQTPQKMHADPAETATERPQRPLTGKQLAMRSMNGKYGIGKIPKDCGEWKSYCETYGTPKPRPAKQLESLMKKYNGNIPLNAPDFVQYCALHGVPASMPAACPARPPPPPFA